MKGPGCLARGWLLLTGLAVFASAAAAQTPVYDSIAAGQEASQRGEGERLQAIGQQIQTIDRMAWLSGQVTLYPYPPLEAVYAYGGRRAYRTAVQVPYVVPRYAYPAGPRLGVFEPWPLVPGDIYGPPHLARAPQPIGHETIVIGPGRTLYRPIYAAPAPASAVPTAPPAPAAPPAPEAIPTPPPVEPSRPGAAPRPQGGPREF